MKCHHVVRDIDEWNAPATNKFDTHLDIEDAKREKGVHAMDDKRPIQIHDQAYLSYDEMMKPVEHRGRFPFRKKSGNFVGSKSVFSLLVKSCSIWS